MASINYTISFPNAKAHYAAVSIELTPSNNRFVDVKVPVWTPGSYKVREFSLNMDRFNANQNGQDLNVELLNKNTWRVHLTSNAPLQINYNVYGFTVSVRQSYIDQFYAFVHGVSAFAYIDNAINEEIILKINPLESWNNVEIAAERLKAPGFVYRLSNYDELADSPMALGNFDTIDYESGKTPHKVVMIGKGNYNLNRVKTDFKTISDKEVELFGDHPSDYYIHFIYNVENGGGGLEHANCQTSMVERWSYTDQAKYKSFLGLVAHEYFHLWNVKRIRAIELGPFQYDTENYTDMLWVAEGITSYYDDLLMFRAGFHDQDAYLDLIAGQINRYENTIGKDVMDLTTSSKLAWIKSYMPNENSSNTSISYYNKGMILALLLDLQIINATNGNKSLDNVMTSLWSFYKEKDRGFTFDEFKEVCEQVAGQELNQFFDSLLTGKGAIEYGVWFENFGLQIKDLNEHDKKAYCGLTTKLDNGKVTIVRVDASSPATIAGLSVNDEIISINDIRLISKMEDQLSLFEVDQELTILYARDGIIRKTQLILEYSPEIKFKISLDRENKLGQYWINRMRNSD